MAQKLPQMKKTFGPRSAFPGPESVKYGVEYAIAQLRSQLDAVVKERHFARAFRGNNSPVTTHATGPQLDAKKKM